MQTRTIQVKQVSDLAGEREIHEFFYFSGEIKHIEIMRGAAKVEDVQKLLRATQLERTKSKLRKVPESCITYSKFIELCEENRSDQDQAKKIAKMLDDSATVIILGNVVFLKPEQWVRFLEHVSWSNGVT